MSWMTASLRGGAIFLFFVVFTVIVPDFVVSLDPVASAADIVRDAIVLAVWGAGLVGGLWLLRRGQSRGLI